MSYLTLWWLHFHCGRILFLFPTPQQIAILSFSKKRPFFFNYTMNPKGIDDFSMTLQEMIQIDKIDQFAIGERQNEAEMQYFPLAFENFHWRSYFMIYFRSYFRWKLVEIDKNMNARWKFRTSVENMASQLHLAVPQP